MDPSIAYLICSELASNGLTEEAQRVWAACQQSNNQSTNQSSNHLISQISDWRQFAYHLPPKPLTSICKLLTVNQSVHQPADGNNQTSQSTNSSDQSADILATGSRAVVPCFRWRPLRFECDRPVIDSLNQSVLTRNAFSAIRDFRSRPNQSSDSLTEQSSVGSASWRGLKIIRGHLGPIYCCSFDSSNRLIATGSDDYLVKVWCASTLKLLLTLRGHAAPVSDIVFSSDSSILATSSVDATVRVWDLQRGELVRVFAHQHTANVLKIAFIQSDRYLVSASQDGTGCVFDLAQPDEPVLTVHARPQHLQLSYDVSFSLPTRTSNQPRVDPALLANAPAPISPRHHHHPELSESRINPSSSSFKAEFLYVSISPDNDEFAIASNDRTIRIFAWPSAQLSTVLQAHTGEVLTVSYNHTGSRIFGLDDSGEVLVWERVTRTLAPTTEFVAVARLRIFGQAGQADVATRMRLNRPPSIKIKQATWSLDQSCILTTDSEGTLRCWRINQSNQADKLFQTAKRPSSQTLKRSSSTAIKQSQRRQLVCAQLVYPEWSVRMHKGDVPVIKTHPFLNDVLLTGGEDERIILWNLRRGEAVRVWNCPKTKCADASFSSHGDACAVSTQEGAVWLFGLGSRVPFSDTPAEQFFFTDFAPLTRDVNNYVIDTNSGVPPHLMPPQLMISANGAIYDPQPVIPACRHGRKDDLLNDVTSVDRDSAEVIAMLKSKQLRLRLMRQMSSHPVAGSASDNPVVVDDAPQIDTRSDDYVGVLTAALDACHLNDELVESDSDYDDLDFENPEEPILNRRGRPASRAAYNSQNETISDEFLEAQRLMDEEIANIEGADEEKDEDYNPFETDLTSPSPRRQSTPLKAKSKAGKRPGAGRRTQQQEYDVVDFVDMEDDYKDEFDDESEYEDFSQSEDDNWDAATVDLEDENEDVNLSTRLSSSRRAQRREQRERDKPRDNERERRHRSRDQERDYREGSESPREKKSRSRDQEREYREESDSPREKKKSRKRKAETQSRSKEHKRSGRSQRARRVEMDESHDEDGPIMSHPVYQEEEEEAVEEIIEPIDPLSDPPTMEQTMRPPRDWLHSTVARYGRYIPQVGDRVCYFRAGHQGSLKARSVKAGPSAITRFVCRDQDGFITEVEAPEAFECQVVDVKYLFEWQIASGHPIEIAERVIRERQERSQQSTTQSNGDSSNSHRLRARVPPPVQTAAEQLERDLSLDPPPSPTWIAPFFLDHSVAPKLLVGMPFPRVICRVKLKPLVDIVQTAGRNQSFTVVPSNEQEEDTNRLKLRRYARSFDIATENVDWCDDGEPDWLVLSYRVWQSLSVNWTRQPVFRVYYPDVDRFYLGKIVSNALVTTTRRASSRKQLTAPVKTEQDTPPPVSHVAIVPMSCPRREELLSAWGCFGVIWIENQGDASRPGRKIAVETLSPWEIEPSEVNPDEDPIRRTDTGIYVDLRQITVNNHFIDEQMLSFLLNLIRECRSNPEFEYLNFPVVFADYPSYLYMIAYPMCLGWIQQRLNSHYYRSLAAFLHDVRQIKIAAIEFNTPRENGVVMSAFTLVSHVFTACYDYLTTIGNDNVDNVNVSLDRYAPWQRFLKQQIEQPKIEQNE